MTGLFNRRLKILLVVTVILLVVTVTLYAIQYLKPNAEFVSNTTTSSTADLMTTPYSSDLTTETLPEETTTTEETTTEMTTEVTTTTEPTTTQPKHHFSHLIIFLDVQRAVFFHTNANGDAFPEVSLRVSTGRVAGSTPVTPPNKPFILSGYRANQLLFTKAETWVWVRYATHVSGDIFIHSQPYDHQTDASGKTLPLDKSLFSKWGYNRLGKNTASNGCIRLSLRDAKYLSENIHRGMPCYIFASSKGFKLPEAPENPPANLNNRWDPTDPDPLNPYVHRAQKSMAWKYAPSGQDLVVKINEQPDAVNGVKNSAKLPSGTTYSFKTRPDTRTAGVIKTKVIVKYPDRSTEEVSIKIQVLDPRTTTPTATTTSTTELTTAPSTPKPTSPSTPKPTTPTPSTPKPTTEPESSETSTTTTAVPPES